MLSGSYTTSFLSGDFATAMTTLMRTVVATIAVAASVSGCSDTCRNTVVSTAVAPGGAQQALLFQRDCGATTGFSSQVSLTTSSASSSGSGNAFVADTGHGSAKASAWGGPWVQLHWQTPQRLLIRYDREARVFTKNRSAAGVSITYEAVSR